MKRIAYLALVAWAAGSIGFASRFGIGDWQYWLTVAPAAFLLGWLNQAREQAR